MMALDIAFRLKRYKKNEWFFVELKQDDDDRRCVDRMCRDAGKVFAARKRSTSDLRIRYIACAGIFLHPGTDKLLGGPSCAWGSARALVVLLPLTRVHRSGEGKAGAGRRCGPSDRSDSVTVAR
jgi:hypothetical protein